MIALFPGLAPVRIPLALVLLLVVAGLTWFGHGGRLLFAFMTVAFVVISVAVLILGFAAPHTTGHAASTANPGHPAMLAVVLAFPVAMALATGIEAPSTAIAQLGQLDDTHRRRFGRGTLAPLVVIVGGLTLALTALGVQLHIGIVAAAGQEQELVLFYAVAVFVSFLVGLLAMTRFARTERKPALAWLNGIAAAAVAFTLVVNLLRGWPVLSRVATVLIAAGLYVRWNRAGQPTGIEDVEAQAETA
ncbi:hypothetical protein ACFZDJ_22705 [Streptomyces sp. NPDC007896]|uniref:hypothetical protein n=1 Tax=unclassified Streptomyces TaxID=2593676 RepID=UPI0036F07732